MNCQMCLDTGRVDDMQPCPHCDFGRRIAEVEADADAELEHRWKTAQEHGNIVEEDSDE